MELSPRLLKIASLVPNGSVVADVGTDHGYIPLYLFRNGVISHAIAMDVNPMPLKRAENNITDSGYGNMCEFRLSDGYKKLSPGEADVIVTAGMGGLLIRDIIEKSIDIIIPDTTLILQPMIAPAELRYYLYTTGFNIENEYVVREENKYYNIMAAKRGESGFTDEDIYIGRNLKQNSPETYDDYIAYKLRVCKNIIEGIRRSKNPDAGELNKKMHEYEVYRHAGLEHHTPKIYKIKFF